ncbi:MAG: hypothetical protein QOF49_858 [Chloroflexota bacterium]|jgi:hypothetical protein|nr:hypothetical protein [Chloroflexota bacterium]
MQAPTEPHPIITAHLDRDEEIREFARATEAVLALTDRRLVVASDSRVALSVPLRAIRRIQFDIERNRPATLVIVPEMSNDEPQVLAIPPEEYRAAADALVSLGLALHEMASGERP